MSFTPTIDGYFDTPIEVEGSPFISVDEVTLSIIIKRKYAQKLAFYDPVRSGISDPIYGATFITEATSQIQGPIVWFERTFATVPSARTEQRMVAFTRPGQSATTLSAITHLPIGWSQYGLAAPSTKLVIANVQYTYQNSPIFSPPATTQIFYKGAPVDYAGSVFVQGPLVVVANNVPIGGSLVTETRWISDGVTSPPTVPSSWVLNANITRWRGPIWQMEVITVPNVI